MVVFRYWPNQTKEGKGGRGIVTNKNKGKRVENLSCHINSFIVKTPKMLISSFWWLVHSFWSNYILSAAFWLVVWSMLSIFNGFLFRCHLFENSFVLLSFLIRVNPCNSYQCQHIQNKCTNFRTAPFFNTSYFYCFLKDFPSSLNLEKIYSGHVENSPAKLTMRLVWNHRS